MAKLKSTAINPIHTPGEIKSTLMGCRDVLQFLKFVDALGQGALTTVQTGGRVRRWRRSMANNPLVDSDVYQTLQQRRCVLAFLADAKHEDGLNDDETFGRYLILETVGNALKSAQDSLCPELAERRAANG
jgi:hypothetical protein